MLATGCHGATGDAAPAPADAAEAADAHAADAPDEDDGALPCADTCGREGPACDPSGSNRLGTCARSASTGCFAVSDLAPCPTGSSVCVAGTSRCVMAGFVVAPHGDDANPEPGERALRHAAGARTT
ncbi:MAG: hypothetical protein NVSMB47_09740 [Polyangiales bacterium]